jgi:hypothetical protein
LMAFERFQACWPLEEEGEMSFSTFFTFPPQQILHKPSFFPLILRFYFTVVLDHYFMPFLPFLSPINYNHTSQCTKSSTNSLLSWFWLKIFFPFLKFMASCMTTSYEPQTAQVNEDLPLESSLNLTLTQHLRDENPKA